ncbi:hypothetical protein Cs7R123_48370 [Catellatospora sp. TT07R-123]|uniref:hypothetical protein n=1 Tax=Catellatospora sp. TT07R-123 TaxID=2733863 RepID=UPI001B0E56CD|nr:hypothetical protein [Catellatospora sp. TT07R-123]GHJ47495.1 hypothetical protein Cs7R123_48370 [Catellatospora sp. TT07R-123]
MRLHVDRITLTVPPMSEQDARRLAELVAEALRDWPTAPDASGRVERVAATVPGDGRTDPRTLASQIAEAVVAAALGELR